MGKNPEALLVAMLRGISGGLSQLLPLVRAQLDELATLQSTGEFIEQGLGLITAVAQQQTCRLTLVRQHLLGKDQFTTTHRDWWIRSRADVLWLY